MESHISMSNFTLYFHEESLKNKVLKIHQKYVSSEDSFKIEMLKLLVEPEFENLLTLERNICSFVINKDISHKDFYNNLEILYHNTLNKIKNKKPVQEKLDNLKNNIVNESWSYDDYKELKVLLNRRGCQSLKGNLKVVFFYINSLELEFLKLYDIFHKKTNNDMLKKFQKFEALYPELKNIQNLKKNQEKFKIITNNWNGYFFTFLQNISVCPYCQSQYIYTYYALQGKKEGGIRPELDHYFPKSRHPLLAVSAYNLIPSCKQCNSSIKGDDIDYESLVNLYLEEINSNFEFYIVPQKAREGTSETDSLVGKSLNYDISYRASKFKAEEFVKIEKFLDSFHIKNRYSFLKKHIKEQLYLRVSHPKIVRDSLEKNFDLNFRKNNNFEIGNNRFLGKVLDDLLLQEIDKDG
ncbi:MULTISPECIES: HNH endonuclease [Enterococcus]|uniref:HNH endonuclease n=1 Tax=Enterococcus TaxID=1350 RepID=UPI00188395A8|nr:MULTISPECIES: hypothetical protein [Enterococcus]MBE9900381.1 hypothetical protein [Enterococcus casseliflavus]MBE9903666.1 hypothetical protein [Enterococcus casseliflavus]MBE9924089.1 hypothetical protein [Enterococcus casseliflavus]MBK0039309.1 hypothetical protein [Enterococcus sp. S52]MBK0071972.1 hypothetical protein [Enterococcus sp. S53]